MGKDYLTGIAEGVGRNPLKPNIQALFWSYLKYTVNKEVLLWKHYKCMSNFSATMFSPCLHAQATFVQKQNVSETFVFLI